VTTRILFVSHWIEKEEVSKGSKRSAAGERMNLHQVGEMVRF
jgi:hypothetical protein